MAGQSGKADAKKPDKWDTADGHDTAAMAAYKLRVAFVRGFSDAASGCLVATIDYRNNPALLQAWEFGHAHFRRIINTETDRLQRAAMDGRGFPDYRPAVDKRKNL